MAETAFSVDGKYFSSISQDGRLRIWDTETNVLKQEYTPDLHLTAPPSCLQWISVTHSSGTQRERRKSVSSEQETQCIALGTNSGKILIYSVAQAKVETILENETKEVQKKGITSLDWHINYGLFSVSKENIVTEWNLQSAVARNKYNISIDKSKQASVSAIKIVPHHQKTQAKYIITASSQVHMWRLFDGQADLLKCLGKSASMKAMLTIAQLNNMCWLVEGSQNERLLSFWDVTISPDLAPQMNGEDHTPNRKKRKKSTSNAVVVPIPTYNFVLEDAPKQIDVDVRKEDEGCRLSLAAVTRSGVVHYYGHLLNGASSKPIKPSVTIQVTTAEAVPLPLQCVRLPAPQHILLGYLEGPALLFERITPDLKTKTQVLIRGAAKEGKRQKKARKQSEVTKVQEGQMEHTVTYVEPMGGVTRKRVTPGATVEVPMEERLANLTVDLQARSQEAVSANLTRLLAQGLHSNDDSMIQAVLSHSKQRVAEATLGSLPAELVPRLLQRLADMANSRTATCACVCVWTGALLRRHAALLLATAPRDPHLARLLAALTHRRSHLCQLLNLKGRLELTMSQREQKPDMVAQAPLLEYNDSSSEEEMEVERAVSDGEQSAHAWTDSSDGDGEGAGEGEAEGGDGGGRGGDGGGRGGESDDD